MILKNPLDMHLHLRDNQMLELIAPLSARDFCAAVIMPNLIPPLCNLEDLKAYKMRIIKVCKDENFTPLMTLFLKIMMRNFFKLPKMKFLALSFIQQELQQIQMVEFQVLI